MLGLIKFLLMSMTVLLSNLLIPGNLTFVICTKCIDFTYSLHLFTSQFIYSNKVITSFVPGLMLLKK